MNRPWFESINFEKELSNLDCSAAERVWIEQFESEGIVHLPDFFDTELCDDMVRELEKDHSHHYDKEQKVRRVHDIWKDNPDSLSKRIAADERIIELLKLLYRREPIPFQTLHFKWGSEQRAHGDNLHFDSMPERYMCGIWTALEDADESNGTIFYYPGSHKLPSYYLQDISSDFEARDDRDSNEYYAKDYQDFIEDLMHHHHIEKKVLNLKKGDVVIWSSNMVHGGGKVTNDNLTRYSQVTHYYFEDCIYYVPMFSNIRAGEYRIKKIYDLRTQEQVEPSYNGHKLDSYPLGNDMYSLSPKVNEKLRKPFWKKIFNKP